MKFSFICDLHRSQLQNNAAQAIRFWQDGFDTAQFFNGQCMWSDAIPHAGCAFEIAEILICKRKIEMAVAYEWFFASTKLLTEGFLALDYLKEAAKVLDLAISRFDRELTIVDSDKNLILDYLLKLHYSENYLAVHDKADMLLNTNFKTIN